MGETSGRDFGRSRARTYARVSCGFLSKTLEMVTKSSTGNSRLETRGNSRLVTKTLKCKYCLVGRRLVEMLQEDGDRLRDVEDLCELAHVHEASVLDAIEERSEALPHGPSF